MGYCWSKSKSSGEHGENEVEVQRWVVSSGSRVIHHLQLYVWFGLNEPSPLIVGE